MNANGMAMELMNNFARVGVPLEILTDPGTNYVPDDEATLLFTKKQDSTDIHTAPANGL